MAKAIDNFDDLNELCSDNDEMNDSLTDQFNKAANHLQKIVSTLDNQTLLTLYGYYKQGSQGPCNTPKPIWYDMKAKAKWESWKQLRDLSQNDAKNFYIDTVKKIDPNFDNSSTSSNSKESWVSVSVLRNDTNSINESDKTLIDYVKENNCKKVEEILLQTTNKNTKFFNKLDENGLGLIHWATDRGSLDMLKLLLKFGADISLQDVDGQTALHYASSCGHINCVKFLLENHAPIDVADNDNLDPLSVACNDDVKELFIQI